MRFLTVRHVTVYPYVKPVKLGEHRMMFRPRESHDLRLVRTQLIILPRPVQVTLVARRVRQFGGSCDLRRRNHQALLR